MNVARFGARTGTPLGNPIRPTSLSVAASQIGAGWILASAPSSFQKVPGYIVEQARDVKVVVSLSASGNAVINQVLVDGRPFDPEGR